MTRYKLLLSLVVAVALLVSPMAVGAELTTAAGNDTGAAVVVDSGPEANGTQPNTTTDSTANVSEAAVQSTPTNDSGDTATDVDRSDADIVVSADGSGDYETIQAGVDNANSGDTVLVTEGTYREQVDVDTSVTLVGQNTTLNGTEFRGGTAFALSVPAKVSGFDIAQYEYGFVDRTGGLEITVSQFTVRNSDAGIYAADSSSQWTVSNATVTDTRLGIHARGATGDWDVSAIELQDGYRGIFGRNSMGNWTVSNVAATDITGVVDGLSSGGNWEVSNAISAKGSSVVRGAYSDGNWVVSNVTSSNGSDAVSGSHSTGNWVVSNVTLSNGWTAVTGYEATGDWVVSNVTSSDGTTAVQAISSTGNWSVTNVTAEDSSYISLDAEDSSGNWNVTDYQVINATEESIGAVQSSSDWEITDYRVIDSPGGIEATGSSGDWNISSYQIASPRFGVFAGGAIGKWNFSRGEFTRGGIHINQSEGTWSILDTRFGDGADLFGVNTSGSYDLSSSEFTAEDLNVRISGNGTWEFKRTNFRNQNESINATGQQTTVDGTRNWWGQPSGPTDGQVVGDVNTSNPCESPCADIGENITVAKDGSGDYETIQAAVNNASSRDTVFVTEGTYREQVEVNTSAALVGQDATLNGSEFSGGTALTLSAATNVSDFDIVHYHTGIDDSTDNAAVNISNISISDGEFAVGANRSSSRWAISNATFSNLDAGIAAINSTQNWAIFDSKFTNGGRAINALQSSGDWTISDYYVNGLTRTDRVMWNHGILADNSSGNWKIKNYEIANSTGTGIQADYSTENWKVKNIKIDNITDNGIQSHDSSGYWTIKNVSHVGGGSGWTIGGVRSTGDWNISNVRMNDSGGIFGDVAYGDWKITNTTAKGGTKDIYATYSTGDWNIANYTSKSDWASGVYAYGSHGNFSLTNSTLNGDFRGVYADYSSSNWNISNVTFSDSKYAIDAIESTGDWNISGSDLVNTTHGISTSRSGGNWSLSNVRFRATEYDILGETSTGNYSILRSEFIRDTTTSVRVSGNGSWTFDRTNFRDRIDVINATGQNNTVNATHNWWGQPSGPTDGQVVGDVNTSNPCSRPCANGTADVTQPLAIESVTTEPAPPTVGEEMTLTASVTGGAGDVEILWYQDGRLTGGGETITPTFDNYGNTTVTVTATDDSGSEVESEVELDVRRANYPPEIDAFTVDSSTVQTGEAVTFDVAADDRDDTDLSATIDFDDGTSTTLDTTDAQNVTGETTHTYDESGMYNATVTVTDDAGLTTKRNRTVFVLDSDGYGGPGIVTFEANRSRTYRDTPVKYSLQVGGDIESIRYRLPNGTTVNQPYTIGRTSYTLAVPFQDEGIQTVQVVAIGDEGGVAAESVTVDVGFDADVSVTPRVSGAVLPGVNITNKYTASVDTQFDIDRVRFELGDRTVVDDDPTDGWKAWFNVGKLDSSTHMTVTAVSEGGPTETTTRRVRVIDTPRWLDAMIKQGNVKSVDPGDGEIVIKRQLPPGGGLRMPIPFGKYAIQWQGGVSYTLTYDMSDGYATIKGSAASNPKVTVPLGSTPLDIGVGGGPKAEVEGTVSTERESGRTTLNLERLRAYLEQSKNVEISFDVTSLLKESSRANKFFDRLGIGGGGYIGAGVKGGVQMVAQEQDGDTDALELQSATVGGQLSGKRGLKVGSEYVVELKGEAEFVTSASATTNTFSSEVISSAGLESKIVVRATASSYLGECSVSSLYNNWDGAKDLIDVFLPGGCSAGGGALTFGPRYIGDGARLFELSDGPSTVGRPAAYGGQTFGTVNASPTNVSTETMLTDNGRDDESPAVTKQGGAYTVAWSGEKPDSENRTGHEIYARTYEPESGWTSKVQVTTNGKFDTEPVVAAGSDNTTAIAWSQVNSTTRMDSVSALYNDTEIAYTLSNGSEWSETHTLDLQGTWDKYPEIAAHGDRWMLAWEQDRDGEPYTINDTRIAYAVVNQTGSVQYRGAIDDGIKPSLSSTDDGFRLGYINQSDGDIRVANGTTELTTAREFRARNVTSLDSSGESLAWTQRGTNGSALMVANSTDTTSVEPRATVNGPSGVRIATSGDQRLLVYEGISGQDGNNTIQYQRYRNGEWSASRPQEFTTNSPARFSAPAVAANETGFLTLATGTPPSGASQDDIYYGSHRYRSDLDLTLRNRSRLENLNASVGEPITVPFTVRNTGDVATGTETTLRATSGENQSSVAVPDLAAGERYNGTVELSVGSDGTVTLRADAADELDELDEGNNDATVRVAQSNLRITETATGRRGDIVWAQVTVENDGQTTAGSVRAVLGDGPQKQSVKSVGSLAPGENATVTVEAHIDNVSTDSPVRIRAATGADTDADSERVWLVTPDLAVDEDTITFRDTDDGPVATVQVTNMGDIGQNATVSVVTDDETLGTTSVQIGSAHLRRQSETVNVSLRNATAGKEVFVDVESPVPDEALTDNSALTTIPELNTTGGTDTGDGTSSGGNDGESSDDGSSGSGGSSGGGVGGGGGSFGGDDGGARPPTDDESGDNDTDAGVSVENVSLDNETVTAGQNTTVTAVLTNAGDANTTVPVTVTHDDTAVQTRSVSVSGNDTVRTAIDVSADAAGTYAVVVNDTTVETFTVHQSSTEPTTPTQTTTPVQSASTPTATSQPTATPTTAPQSGTPTDGGSSVPLVPLAGVGLLAGLAGGLWLWRA